VVCGLQATYDDREEHATSMTFKCRFKEFGADLAFFPQSDIDRTTKMALPKEWGHSRIPYSEEPGFKIDSSD
jgi:hypothetical protein